MHLPEAESERILFHSIFILYFKKSVTVDSRIYYFIRLSSLIHFYDFQRRYSLRQPRVLLRLLLFTSDGTVRTQPHSH